MFDRLEWFIIGTLLFSALLPAVLALDNSTIYCIDNTTLMENITVYKDGNQSWYALPSVCQYNCSNLTQSCNPPDYVGDFYTFLIVVGFFIALALVLKYMRRF